MQCSSVQCSSVQCSSVQCSRVQCKYNVVGSGVGGESGMAKYWGLGSSRVTGSRVSRRKEKEEKVKEKEMIRRRSLHVAE